jgi:hypothetical protein
MDKHNVGWAVIERSRNTAHPIDFSSFIVNICFNRFFDIISTS